MKCLVIVGSGFIGHNLVKRLKAEGWWVKVVDLKHCPYENSPADEVVIADASGWELDQHYDRIYQLAADMGGAGFIFTGDNDADIMHNSASINLNIASQAVKMGCGKLFYSSSVCVYPDEHSGREDDPGVPPTAYGWEKMFSEQLYLSYAKNHGLDVKIARFHNTYGPYGTYDGGREKAPAALCRKVIQSDKIEVWGDGEQVRPFIYIDDLLDGIEILMNSDLTGPVNIGPNETVSIKDLVTKISFIEDKEIEIKFIPGPTGGKVRNTDNELIKSLGFRPKVSLQQGLTKTYWWIKSQYD